MHPAHFFDLESPEQLFSLLKTVADDFMQAGGKRTQDLLLLVFGLTHLREWIAPGFDPSKSSPKSPEECFYQSIYGLREFKTLQALCNRSKHIKTEPRHPEPAMATLFEQPFHEEADIGSEVGYDRNQPIGYFVDGQDIDDVIHAVVSFYSHNWFDKGGEG